MEITTSSPSSSDQNPNPNPTTQTPMQSWWESISKARSRIQTLSSILPSPNPPLSSLADSDRPARSLLESQEAYLALSSSLSHPLSGSGSDPLCQWLYETYQSADPDLRLVVLSLIPLVAGIYLSRVVAPQHSNPPSLAGFEALILSLYASEAKERAGKPVLLSMPDLTQPSLYHSPRKTPTSSSPQSEELSAVGVLSPPLEPQFAVKSTKRALIVSVALDCYYKQISQMPKWSKLELCRFVASWAGQNCSCRSEFDTESDNRNGRMREIKDFDETSETEDVVEEMGRLGFGDDHFDNNDGSGGARIPLPWELLQPVLRILGHCLMAPLNSQDVRDAAAFTVRCLYARVSHDLLAPAILATRSLIQLDRRSRLAAKTAAESNAASNANTPSKARKPEVLLVSNFQKDFKFRFAGDSKKA